MKNVLNSFVSLVGFFLRKFISILNITYFNLFFFVCVNRRRVLRRAWALARSRSTRARSSRLPSRSWTPTSRRVSSSFRPTENKLFPVFRLTKQALENSNQKEEKRVLFVLTIQKKYTILEYKEFYLLEFTAFFFEYSHIISLNIHVLV